MHAGVWDGVDYDGGASCEMRQNPRCFSVYLWPLPVAVYILGPEAVLCRDQNPKPTWFLIRILTGQEIQKLVCQDIKIKRQKEAALLQGDGPDFGGPFTRMSHVRPAPARRASARVVFPFSSHTPLRVVERTHYIKRSNSSSTSGVGLNLAPPVAILRMGFEI